MMIPRRIPARREPRPGRAGRKITRRIFQTFETRDVADGMFSAAMTWVEKNPEYEYNFYDNEDRRNFIEKNFTSDVLSAYNKIENGAFRADFWRYCVLFKEGGVYCDVDSVCKLPLDEFIEDDDEFLAARAGGLPFAVSNGFMSARPGHPFLEEAIRRSTELILNSGGRFDGYVVTGPWNLGVSINRVNRRDEKAEHEIGYNTGVPYAYRLLKKNPKTEESEGHLSLGEQIISYTSYQGYRKELENLGISHWQDSKYYKSLSMKAKKALALVRGRVRKLTGGSSGR